MPGLATWLMLASATIVFALGAAHLLYTFRGDKLQPRDPALRERMDAVSPGITRQTTMWRAWLGFNASHSAGALLFGLVYGYLAWVHPGVLFGSAFLSGVGLVFLAGYLVLARKYWFKVPFRGVALALLFFAASLATRMP